MRAIRTCLITALALTLAVSGCKKKSLDSTAAIAAKAGPVQPPGAVQVPPVVVAWVVAGNPQQLLTSAEGLASKASPVPQGALAVGISQALIQLGLKDTSVVDLSGPAGMVLLDGNKHEDPMVVAVTTKGPEAVAASLQPAWKSQGVKDGVQAFSRQVVDPYAVFKGGDKNAKTIEQNLFIRYAGKLGLVATSRGALADGGPVLLERLAAGAPAQGLTGMLHMTHLRDTLAMQLATAPAMFKGQISYALTNGAGKVVMLDKEFIEWIVGWVVDKFFAFIQQTHTIGVAVGLSDEGAVVHLTLAPEPNTFFAKLLAEQKPAELGLSAALPQDAFLAMGMDVQWAFMKADIAAFAQEIMDKLSGKQADEKLRALIKEWLAVTGDELAISEDLDAEGGLRLVELIRVTDEARARKAVHALMAMSADFYGEDGIMGVRATVEGPTPLGEHDGVSLEKTLIRMDLSALQPAQAQMMRQAYGGDALVMVTAVFDKTFGLAFGKHAEADLKATIDRMRKPGGGLTATPEFKSAAGGLDANAGAIVYISLSKFIASTIRSTYAMTGAQAPALKVPPAKSGLFWRTRTEAGRMVNTIRLPAAHLAEVGAVLQSLTQMSTGAR